MTGWAEDNDGWGAVAAPSRQVPVVYTGKSEWDLPKVNEVSAVSAEGVEAAAGVSDAIPTLVGLTASSGAVGATGASGLVVVPGRDSEALKGQQGLLLSGVKSVLSGVAPISAPEDGPGEWGHLVAPATVASPLTVASAASASAAQVDEWDVIPGKEAPVAAYPDDVDMWGDAIVAPPTTVVLPQPAVVPKSAVPEISTTEVAPPTIREIRTVAPRIPAPVEALPAVPTGSIDDPWAFDDESPDQDPVPAGETPPAVPPFEDVPPTPTRVLKRGEGRTSKKHHDPLRLTERDIEILSFLARYRIATTAQISARVSPGSNGMNRRLPALEGAGYLASGRVGRGTSVRYVTAKGLAVLSSNLPRATPAMGNLNHTFALVDLGTLFELAGEVVVTEREIRAATTFKQSSVKSAIDSAQRFTAGTPADPATLAGLPDQFVIKVKGRPEGHYPDMALVRGAFPNGASGNIAIELELSRKSAKEWNTILWSYAQSALYEKVYYYVTNREVERGLTEAIARIGAGDKIKVLRFHQIEKAGRFLKS